MPAYVFANIRVDDPIAYQRYVQIVPGTIEKYGGRYLARGGGWRCWRATAAGPHHHHGVPHVRGRADAGMRPRSTAAAKGVRQSCARADLVIVDGM